MAVFKLLESLGLELVTCCNSRSVHILVQSLSYSSLLLLLSDLCHYLIWFEYGSHYHLKKSFVRTAFLGVENWVKNRRWLFLFPSGRSCQVSASEDLASEVSEEGPLGEWS